MTSPRPRVRERERDPPSCPPTTNNTRRPKTGRPQIRQETSQRRPAASLLHHTPLDIFLDNTASFLDPYSSPS